MILVFKRLRYLTYKHVLACGGGATGTDEAVIYEYFALTRHITFGWTDIAGRMERTETETADSDLQNTAGMQRESGPSALFAPTSAENMPVKEDRVFRKAKRSLKVNSKQDDASTTARNGLLMSAQSPTSPTGARYKGGPLPFSKNSRRCRNLLFHGRGQPKKGRIFSYCCEFMKCTYTLPVKNNSIMAENLNKGRFASGLFVVLVENGILF